MAETDIVSTITLRLVSDITEQLKRDDVALTTFAAKVESLKATNLGAIGAPSVAASGGSVAALTAIENGSAKASAGMNGYSSSVRLASGEEVKLAVVAEATAARLAEAAAKASDAETAAAMRASDRAIAAAQRQQVAVARAFEMDAKAAETASAKQQAALVSVGKGAGLLTLGIAGIGYETSKMAATFQREMEKVHTQAGASQKEVDSLSNSLLVLSGKVGTSPDLLAQSLYHVESAGFRGAKALDMVRAAAMGAKIGNADLETVTQAMIATQASHIKGVKDDTDAMAQLNAIVGSGDMRMEGLAEAMSTGLLPAAANAGLSLRDVGAALATVTDNATPPMEAATRLRMTIALLAAPSGAAAKALEAVGISASDANAALSHRDELAQYGIHITDLSADLRKPNGLLVALQDLKKHLDASKLSLTEQDAVLSRAFGGGRSSAVIQTLYSQLDRLTSKYKEQAVQATKFQEDWNKTTQTTAFQAAQEKANIDALGIAFGQGLVPAVTELLKVITPLTLGFAKFTSEHKTFTADTLLLVGGVAGTVALVSAMTKVVLAVRAIGTAWKFVAAKAGLATTAEEGANAAALGPALLAVLGPAAVTVAGAAYISQNRGENQKGNVSAFDKETKAYEAGTISTDQYTKDKESFLEHGHGNDYLTLVKKITDAETEGTKAGHLHADAIKRIAQANADAAEWAKQYAVDLHSGINATTQHTAATDKESNSIGRVAEDYRAARFALAEWNRERKHSADSTDVQDVVNRFQAARSGLHQLNEEQGKAAAAAAHHAATLKELDAELKKTLASEIALTNQGLVKEKAAFVSMADSAIEQAKRMRAGVEIEAKAMQVAITKSVAWTPILQPPVTQITPSAALNNHQASFGPVGTQFPTSGPSYNPNGAQTMDPALAASMSGLTSAIHALPPEFQGAFDGELSKYKQQQTDIYNQYLASLNKENRAYADGIKSINSDYHAKLAANLKEANAKEVVENTRYLDKLDSLERAHNDRLQAINSYFLTAYQTLVVNYQGALAQAQMKAQADALAHEDRERQLAADEQAKLAGIHGKNAAARRQAVMEQYSRDVGKDDTNYQRTVTANENHVKGLSTAFDKHVAAITSNANRLIAQANTHLVSGKESAAQIHSEAIAGIKSWLTGHDTAAEGKREAALLKLDGIHIKHVHGITEVFDKHGKLLEKWGKAQSTPEALLKTIGSNNDTEYNKALAKATLDILEHGHATRADIDALQSAQAGRTEIQNAENAATLLATANLNDLAASISALNTLVDQKENAAAGLLYAGATNIVPPGSAADKRRQAQRRAEGLPDDRPSTYTGDINAAIAAKIEAGGKSDARAKVDAAVDTGAGDAAGAYSLLLPLYQKGAISLTDFIGTANAASDATKAETQRMIELGEKTGDYLSILDLSKKAYLDGSETLEKYVGDVKGANAQTAANNVLLEAAAKRLGNWTEAAGYALTAYQQGTGTFQDAVDTQKHANDATKASTDKQWDVAFAAGDLATQSQMLSAAFSGLISQASTIASAQAAVDNAKLGVIAAESAVQVQLLQSEVTATQDLGGIITAQAGIQKAISDGQISAINDSTTIMQNSYGVEVAQAAVSQAILTGNSLSIAIANAGLKVAQDTLQIDRVTAEMDAANARWSIRIAEDQARLAMDKLLTDNANSAATARVLMDHLAVAHDAVDIALAQQKLTLDSMVILANIDSTLGGVTDYRDLITGDLAGLDKAQKQSTADQYKEAYDQANASQIAAQGGLTLAGDQNSLNSDQASAASVSQAFLLQLAELKKIAAGDTISQQRLQAMEASLSTIAKDAGTIAASAKASEELLERIRELNNRGLEGLQRIDVTGSSTASMTNGLGAQMAQNPTHG